ncbi:hypothetical protein MMPV_006500 [Pyropia vietnamensis]
MTSRGGSALRPGIPPPGSAARPGTALAKPSLTTPSADVRAAYHRRLDALVTTITDSYLDALREAALPPPSDPAAGAVSALRTEAATASVAAAADELLQLVSELKVAAVVYDVGSGAKDATNVKDGLERSRRVAEETLRTLAGRSAALLRELEVHYYASVAGVGVDNTGRVGEF